MYMYYLLAPESRMHKVQHFEGQSRKFFSGVSLYSLPRLHSRRRGTSFRVSSTLDRRPHNFLTSLHPCSPPAQGVQPFGLRARLAPSMLISFRRHCQQQQHKYTSGAILQKISLNTNHNPNSNFNLRLRADLNSRSPDCIFICLPYE